MHCTVEASNGRPDIEMFFFSLTAQHLPISKRSAFIRFSLRVFHAPITELGIEVSRRSSLQSRAARAVDTLFLRVAKVHARAHTLEAKPRTGSVGRAVQTKEPPVSSRSRRERERLCGANSLAHRHDGAVGRVVVPPRDGEAALAPLAVPARPRVGAADHERAVGVPAVAVGNGEAHVGSVEVDVWD